MRRLFGVVTVSRRRKLAFLLTALAGALAATGFGAYAAASGGGTITACAKPGSGLLRLDSGGGCLPTEQAVQWNQTGPPGPPGPPGNTDSTVRHISGFMFDGHTVTTPLLSAKGEFAKLALTCGTDANGSNGQIVYTSESDNLRDSVAFNGSTAPSSPTFVQVNPGDSATFPWGSTSGNNVSFQLLIESLLQEPAQPPPSLTEIHGFVQGFPQYTGCAYYVFVDTSDVASPSTVTP